MIPTRRTRRIDTHLRFEHFEIVQIAAHLDWAPVTANANGEIAFGRAEVAVDAATPELLARRTLWREGMLASTLSCMAGQQPRHQFRAAGR